MKTFVVFTSCKVTLSSVEGSLNTQRVFSLAARVGFLVFLFSGTFSPQNEQLFFKERGNELGKSKMERPMAADSKDKLFVSVVSF